MILCDNIIQPSTMNTAAIFDQSKDPDRMKGE